MAWFWWAIVIGVIAMWVIALVDIIRHRRSMSGGKLAAWILLILIFPVLGAIVYFLVNAGSARPAFDERGRDQAMQDRQYGA